MHAIQYAQVVVLLVDARAPLEKQDLTIARRVVDEGRALLLAANKWDLIDDRQAALHRLHDRLETSLTQVRGLPIVTLSASMPSSPVYSCATTTLVQIASKSMTPSSIAVLNSFLNFLSNDQILCW